MKKTQANYIPLSPISFIKRAAEVYPNRKAVVSESNSFTYAEFYERCRLLASGLKNNGLASGDKVAVMAPNSPELLESHFGVPGAEGVLVSINTRLGLESVRFILEHSGSRFFIVDHDFLVLATDVVATLDDPPKLFVITDAPINDQGRGDVPTYNDLLDSGTKEELSQPGDEWTPIAINYTSGTTGNPKGVVLHHRGAYLNACANGLAFKLDPKSVYLWTLPMFHCNGWSHTWAVTMVGGTHVCQRKVNPKDIFDVISREGVTHMCAAPVVLNMLLNSPDLPLRPFDHQVNLATGGAAPPSTVIEKCEKLGFTITHLYGMTELYGPSAICMWQPGLDNMNPRQKAKFMSRQGVGHPMIEEFTVIDPDTEFEVPADGQTMGEIVVRSNTVMMGYYENPSETKKAFKGGWFHTGDLAVIHADGYIEIKDRSKDIIISGGENISSLEIEEILYQHPDIIEASVVARPDEKWGETPQAFITVRFGSTASEDEIYRWCKERLDGFKVPRFISFCELPKTSTGKIQKFKLREIARENHDNEKAFQTKSPL